MVAPSVGVGSWPVLGAIDRSAGEPFNDRCRSYQALRDEIWLPAASLERPSALQRVPTSASSSWAHPREAEAVIGSSVDTPSAMTALEAGAAVHVVGPPQTTSARSERPLPNVSSWCYRPVAVV